MFRQYLESLDSVFTREQRKMRKNGNYHLLQEFILVENSYIFFDPMRLEKRAVVAIAGILLCLFPHEKLDKNGVNLMFSTGTKTIAAVLIVTLTTVALFSVLTFPRTTVNLQVSFALGVDNEVKEFDLPFLQDKVLVEVAITTGSALWRASIADVNNSEVWSYCKAQGDSTVYQSEWVALQSGHYSFTFGTIGIGNLDANVKVSSKGGFW